MERHFAPKRDELERGFIDREDKLYRAFKKSPATTKPKLAAFSRECFERGNEEAAAWLPALVAAPIMKGLPFRYRFFGAGKTARQACGNTLRGNAYSIGKI